MSSKDLIVMALRNLAKRKLRTFLTVLGVVIGSASIVVMISIGLGMNRMFEQQLSRWGDLTTITVYGPNYYGGRMIMTTDDSSSMGSQQEPPPLDDSTIASFSAMPGVVAATPMLDLSLNLSSGRYYSWLSVVGIKPEAMEALGFTPMEGRLLQDTDKLNVVYGYEAPFSFYNPSGRGGFTEYYSGEGEDTRKPVVDVMKEKVLFSYGYQQPDYSADPAESLQPKAPEYKMTGVGRLPYGGENNYTAYINLKQAQLMKTEIEKYEAALNSENGQQPQKKTKGYDRALVKCADINTVRDVFQQITDMGFSGFTMQQQLDSMKEMSKSLQNMLGAIGAMSVFIAAIGITNTMIMSIYERTKEIGVMKVIGATLWDIGRLFLTEAALIGVTGGVFGVCLSLGASHLMNSGGFNMLGWGGDGVAISYIPPWLCLAALAFSAAIGLIAGFFPARRAMRLPALSAIRTE